MTIRVVQDRLADIYAMAEALRRERGEDAIDRMTADPNYSNEGRPRIPMAGDDLMLAELAARGVGAPPSPASRAAPVPFPIDDRGYVPPSGTGLIRNNTTGREIRIGQSAAPTGPELDYSRPPVDVFGVGKGHYIKGDPLAAMVDGRRVDFGRSTAEERALQFADLKALAPFAEQERRAEFDERNMQLKEQLAGNKLATALGTRVDTQGRPLPKPQPGFEWDETGTTQRRIPGSKAAFDFDKAKATDALKLSTALQDYDKLISVATSALDAPGLKGNFGVQSLFANWRGGATADANTLLERTKRLAGLSVLNALKAAGGGSSGLGSVTNAEHDILQKAAVALDRAQSLPQVKEALGDLVSETTRSRQRLRNHYASVYGQELAEPDSDKESGIKGAPGTKGVSTVPAEVEAQPTKGNEGKIMTDNDTGKKYRVINGNWAEI